MCRNLAFFFHARGLWLCSAALLCLSQACVVDTQGTWQRLDDSDLCEPGASFETGDGCNDCVCPDSGLRSDASCTLLDCDIPACPPAEPFETCNVHGPCERPTLVRPCYLEVPCEHPEGIRICESDGDCTVVEPLASEQGPAAGSASDCPGEDCPALAAPRRCRRIQD